MRYNGKDANFSDLKGQTLTAVQVEDEEVIFTLADGRRMRLYHQQDCCESVVVDQVDGDPEDLVGQEVLVAEERTGGPEEQPRYSSETWTFYTICTNAADLTIKWVGESNGYYSESVDCEWMDAPAEGGAK